MSILDPRTVELVQRDLDGDLSTAEKAELARRLLADVEVRRLRDDLARTDALLRAVPQAETPAGLRPAILKALSLPVGRRSEGGSGGGWGRFQLAAALLGGLVVVGLGYRLVGTQEDLDSLKGSIAGHAGAAVPDDEVTLPAGDGTITARLFREGGRTRLVIESSGIEPVEVTGQYDAVAMTPRLAPAPGATPGQFSVVLRAADNNEALEFAGTDAIRLEIRVGGQRLGTAVLGSDAQH